MSDDEFDEDDPGYGIDFDSDEDQFEVDEEMEGESGVQHHDSAYGSTVSDQPPSYSDIERTSGGPSSSAGQTGRQKALRDPRSASLDKMWGVLEDIAYEEFHKDIKKSAHILAERIHPDKIVLYSIDILTPAALYIVQYRKVNQKNIKEFIVKSNGLVIVNHLDFIRYIRLLSR